MPFTAQEISTLDATLLPFHIKEVNNQTVQARPAYDDLVAKAKNFPGGREYITERVRGDLSAVSFQGYTHDDQVGYVNPATIKQAKAKWYEVHAGIQTTLTEFKQYGISIVDTIRWDGTTEHSQAENVALIDVLKEKDFELVEDSRRSMADMLWRDGTQDAKAIPGIPSFIVENPAAGTRFGVDSSTETYWRNRAILGIDTSTPANQNLVSSLQKEFRQLRRYGSPQHAFYAGSDFMDAMERELRAKGNYTMEGWANKGKLDASVGDLAFKGVPIVYEPLLDDLGKSKYGYVLDLKSIKLYKMEDEWEKRHAPARPYDRYVIYKAITSTAALLASQLNTSGLYTIA